MARYKDIEPIIDFIKKGLNNPDKAKAFGHDAIEILTEIEYAPTADVVEVRHGKWVHTDYAMHWLGKDECSECTYHTSDRDDLSHLKFCPNCGARMDGDDGETV